MKIRYTEGKRKGHSLDVPEAAARRLIRTGQAEEIKAGKQAEPKAEASGNEAPRKAAKKATQTRG